jgi:hypothetical protein
MVHFVWFQETFMLNTLSSPVPAGSRVTFFAGPKKVTKETTCAALGMKRLCGRTLLSTGSLTGPVASAWRSDGAGQDTVLSPRLMQTTALPARLKLKSNSLVFQMCMKYLDRGPP